MILAVARRRLVPLVPVAVLEETLQRPGAAAAGQELVLSPGGVAAAAVHGQLPSAAAAGAENVQPPGAAAALAEHLLWWDEFRGGRGGGHDG